MIAFEISVAKTKRNMFSDVVWATIKCLNSIHVERRRSRKEGPMIIYRYTVAILNDYLTFLNRSHHCSKECSGFF